ncbi:MAG: hydrogenase nickel incorporation protein HypB [Pirellulales bacterium]|nr:hydrogenase nickel incorporation protein HypB [Pirellulales bacterium]
MSSQTVPINRDIREERRAAAKRFQERMAGQKTLVVRLLSSPGAGKTALLEKTAEHLVRAGYSVGVLVGDVETNRDAERLAPYAPSVQITTGGACHLEMPLIERALPQLGDRIFDFLFIEDVGNLICPASHELGEHVRIILLSVTEGDDKPGKYPKAFRTSQAVVLSKIDLLPYVPFSLERAAEDAFRIQPSLAMMPLSATTGEGVDAWYRYLLEKREILVATAPNPANTPCL